MANIINRQQTFSTNGTVTAAGLHNLIDTALVNSAIIKNQQEITTIGTADLLLIAPDSVDASLAPRKVTVQNLFDDGLTAGTFTSFNLTGALTYGTATGNRTVSTSATITTGTIPNLTAGTTNSTAATITNGTITTGLIPTLTAGTTTGTAGIFTSGTVATLNSTTGTITNLSTTLAGDFTISQGTGTLGTSGVTLGTYGGSTSIPTIVVDAKGRVTTASTSAITSGGLTGFRNRIINGDMRIDQRNAGASSTPATDSYTYNSLDRYFTSVNTPATSTVSQSTSAPATFLYSLKMGRSGSGTAGLNTLGQVIETSNSQDLAGSSVTLSFWAKIGASATFSSLTAYVYSGTTTDQSASSLRGGWTGQATVASTTVTLTTTWTKFSITGTAGSSALQLAAQFVFTTVGAAGADDNLYITGVQLETGSTATDFERRPIGTELALCQRYYAKFRSLTDAYVGFGSGVMQTTTSAFVYLKYPVTMRASPTVSQSSTAIILTGATLPTTALSTAYVGSDSLSINVSVASGGTAGYGAMWVGNNTSSAFVALTIEL